VGIKRASLGVQTFSAHCQQATGRVQEGQLVPEAADWLRQAGVTSLNFDLMYGLPGQSSGDLLDSLQKTGALGADRTALFGYAHVPHVVPRQRVIDASRLPGHASAETLHPFVLRDLVTFEHGVLAIAAKAPPYAKTIAALLDSYRWQSSHWFSSAV